MKRREFIWLLGGAAAWPLVARAQQGERMRRIGVLMSLAADDAESPVRLKAFVQGLQELGWTEGRNVQIDTRWGDGDVDRVRKYVAELVALAPDVILASGGSVVGPLLQATRTYRSCLRRPLIQSVPASSIACHGRAVTSPALPRSNMGWARNGWSCSRRSRWSEWDARRRHQPADKKGDFGTSRCSCGKATSLSQARGRGRGKCRHVCLMSAFEAIPENICSF